MKRVLEGTDISVFGCSNILPHLKISKAPPNKPYVVHHKLQQLHREDIHLREGNDD